MDFLFKVKDCYDSSPKATYIQKNTFLDKYKRRIPLVKKCFQNLESSEFMKHCWFLCQSFHWNKINPIFEGEIRLLKQAFFALASFMRRFPTEDNLKLYYKRLKKKGVDILGEVDGMLSEPLNPSLSVSSVV